MPKFKLSKGAALIASLLLTSIITTTGLQVIKITTAGQKSSAVFSQQLALLNNVKTAQDLISTSIDHKLKRLDQDQGNMYFINLSEKKKDIVNDPDFNNSTIKDIRKMLFDTLKLDPTNDLYNYSEDGNITLDDFNKKNTDLNFKSNNSEQNNKKTGNFTIKMQNSESYPFDNSKVKYTLEIKAAICNQQGICQNETRVIEKIRSCPKPLHGHMQALVGAENLPNNAKENFPDIYCSCTNTTPYSKTTAAGNCEMPSP